MPERGINSPKSKMKPKMELNTTIPIPWPKGSTPKCRLTSRRANIL